MITSKSAGGSRLRSSPAAISLAAYYTGDYKRSLILAQDGQRYAKDGMQAIRLSINGEARALGQIQDWRGADEAVTRAYRLLEQFPTADGMTPLYFVRHLQ
ncbi:MAG: hypothetical protein LC776_11115 [Acidobacteria bacterium]|nr:hypothetical protein [Acidobacteriota bacterium]